MLVPSTCLRQSQHGEEENEQGELVARSNPKWKNIH